MFQLQETWVVEHAYNSAIRVDNVNGSGRWFGSCETNGALAWAKSSISSSLASERGWNLWTLVNVFKDFTPALKVDLPFALTQTADAHTLCWTWLEISSAGKVVTSAQYLLACWTSVFPIIIFDCKMRADIQWRQERSQSQTLFPLCSVIVWYEDCGSSTSQGVVGVGIWLPQPLQKTHLHGHSVDSAWLHFRVY